MVVFFLGLARSIVWLCVDLLAARAVDTSTISGRKKTTTLRYGARWFFIFAFALFSVGVVLCLRVCFFKRELAVLCVFTGRITSRLLHVSGEGLGW